MTQLALRRTCMKPVLQTACLKDFALEKLISAVLNFMADEVCAIN